MRPEKRDISFFRRRYSRSRLIVTALVILLLVPAGVLALRSLAVSLAAADTVSKKRKQVAERDKKIAEKAPKDPFFGTPAESYPAGDAGIAPPAGTQVGDWTPEQVTDVTNRVKQLLVAGRLDPRVITQSDTSVYVNQLAESTRGFAGERLASDQALGYVTRIAPGYALKSPVRVKGAMTVSVGEMKQLVIVADYVWGYALDGPLAKEAEKGAGARVVVLHSVERYEWYPSKRYSKQDQGLRPGDGKHYTFNIDCERAKQGLIALPQVIAKGRKPASPTAIYDPQTPLDKLPSTC